MVKPGWSIEIIASGNFAVYTFDDDKLDYDKILEGSGYLKLKYYKAEKGKIKIQMSKGEDISKEMWSRINTGKRSRSRQ